MKFLILLLALVFMSCANCTDIAKKDYVASLVKCKDEGLKYDECNEKYGIEKTFQDEQVKCRKD